MEDLNCVFETSPKFPGIERQNRRKENPDVSAGCLRHQSLTTETSLLKSEVVIGIPEHVVND
jgi:hypothetical protein